MRKKLVLIQPRFENEKLDRNRGTVPPLGLAYVAACTPEEWEVEIIDEHVENRALPENADLVGITTTTLTICRAYEISKLYRSRGVPVVLGGVHASMLPEEALKYSDSVVIGDAEGIWKKVIEDVSGGKLQKIYKAPIGILDDIPAPRTDLFRGRYSFAPVSSSRGCPFNCEFCAINKFYEGTYRRMPVEKVVDEMCRLKKTNVFFTDGNLFGHSERDRRDFIKLCRLIIKRRRQGRLNVKNWMCYGSLNALDDDEALALAWKAGCRALFIGFESINPDALKQMNKTLNMKYGPESYGSLIQKAHSYRISVVGEIVVGTDHDTVESLDETSEFIRNSNLDILRLQILQPLPGTDLFKRLENEERLEISDFPNDWSKLAGDFVMGVHYKTRSIEKRRLQNWVKQTGAEFYSNINLLKRVFRIMFRSGVAVGAMVLANSLKSRKTYNNYKF